MGIYIKGIKMPARCELCLFSGISGKSCELISCTFTGEHRYFNDGQYMDGCPLIELQPHGRLIDADAMNEKYGDWYTEEGTEEGFIGTLKYLIAEQPTIIGVGG